jgi:hypothetical protein
MQLDRTHMKVMGEIKYVMIKIVTHPKFVQFIDIIVVDIPEAYGLLLRWDWFEKLNGYFSTDWAHLWLPLKGHKNMIIIEREIYLKHTVTDLETLNEPSSTNFPVLGNYSCDSYFGNFSPLSSNFPLTQNSEMIFQEELPTVVEETLFRQEPALEITKLTGGKEESDMKEEVDRFFPQFYTLHFDGSKSQEESGAGFILIDLKGKRHFLSYILEFE